MAAVNLTGYARAQRAVVVPLLSGSVRATRALAAGGVAPTITVSLPTVTAGQQVSIPLTATGSTPIAWGETTGVPAGLAVQGAALVGAAPAVGTYTITFRARNDYGLATSALTLTVAASTAGPVITTRTIPAGTTGSSITTTIAATGSSTLTYSLPYQTTSGASINASSGVLTVPSQAAGSYQLTVRATDATGRFADQSFAVTFAAPTSTPTARRFWIGPGGGGASWRGKGR